MPKPLLSFSLSLHWFLITCFLSQANAELTQEDYYTMESIAIPENIVLEAGGIEQMPNGKVVYPHEGETFSWSPIFWTTPKETKPSPFGQEVCMRYWVCLVDGWLYEPQRPEITRIKDSDSDGRADVETVSDEWGISGDYHEYAFGSKFDPDGNMWVVLCLTGSFGSKVPYRGWCVRVSKDGKMIPTAKEFAHPAVSV